MPPYTPRPQPQPHGQPHAKSIPQPIAPNYALNTNISSDSLLVANELRKYVTAQGQRDTEKHCWKIDAGPNGWGKFFEDNPHLKDADRKPKKFCEAHSATLSWLPDDSAPGKGYITVPEAAAMKPSGVSSMKDAHDQSPRIPANVSRLTRTIKDINSAASVVQQEQEEEELQRLLVIDLESARRKFELDAEIAQRQAPTVTRPLTNDGMTIVHLHIITFSIKNYLWYSLI